MNDTRAGAISNWSSVRRGVESQSRARRNLLKDSGRGGTERGKKLKNYSGKVVVIDYMRCRAIKRN